MVKKKVMVGILTIGLAFGAVGTVALANELPSFKEMLPFMKEMHPNWTDEQLEEMYKSCHGEGGMMGNPDALPHHTNMMNL